MRGVARGTTFGLQRGMFERERALLVTVALDTGGIGSDGELCLFRLKSAMSVMTA